MTLIDLHGVHVTLPELRRISEAVGVNPGAIVRCQITERRPWPLYEGRREVERATVRRKLSEIRRGRM